MEQKEVLFLQDKAAKCKKLLLMSLFDNHRIDSLENAHSPNLLYSELISHLQISQGETWKSFISEYLFFGHFYSEIEVTKLLENKSFYEVCGLLNLFHYHIKLSYEDYYANSFTTNVLYRFSCLRDADLRMMVSGEKLKVAEIRIFNSELEGEFLMDILFGVLWVVKMTKKAPEYPANRNYCSFDYLNIFPKSEKDFLEKALKMKLSLAYYAEEKYGVSLKDDLNSLTSDEIIETVPNLTVVEIKNFLKQGNHIFTSEEIEFLDSLPNVDGFHEGFGNILIDLNQKCEKDGVLMHTVQNCMFLNETYNVAIHFVYRKGWMAEVFIKEKLPFDYLVCDKKSLFTVRFVTSFEGIEILQPLLTEFKNGKGPDYSLFEYHLEKV